MLREHPAEEVFVTGTFDNWGKTVKLDKSGSSHEKTVDLPKEKVLYKVRHGKQSGERDKLFAPRADKRSLSLPHPAVAMLTAHTVRCGRQLEPRPYCQDRDRPTRLR